ncbi:hypothetical protein GSI_08922 [Ganoderma sinense ZZ0214-1]|uniref:Uncharacterized protein n=1 Tax=Ganoderma sinense ZZ0214-1 TaxID=1077348 RepID=A0A2G8S522_9APHY|nr:hypothetical protein GSI_08922 [Ganoderma sinense ZZ0214-1]
MEPPSASHDIVLDAQDMPEPDGEEVGSETEVASKKPSKHVRFKRWPVVERALLSNLPGYQALYQGDAVQKRDWRDNKIEEIIKECPAEMQREYGLGRIRTAMKTWFNNYRKPGSKPAHAGLVAEVTSSQTAMANTAVTSVEPPKGSSTKIPENPLAKALQSRNLSPMRVWGAAHNAKVQERLAKMGGKKIGGWSHCASVMWRELEDEERAEWVKKTKELSVADDNQCFQNQLGIASLLANLLHGLIGVGRNHIGKACFFVRLAYRTPDGQMMYEDISLAEDDDAPNFSHFEGGIPPEEDERWARYANQVVGLNPGARAQELDYDEGTPRLPKWRGEDNLWMKQVLRAYFRVKWESSGYVIAGGWWDGVLEAPETYIIEAWVDDFKVDPFMLDAYPLSTLYNRMYEAEREGNPFSFRHMAAAEDSSAPEGVHEPEAIMTDPHSPPQVEVQPERIVEDPLMMPLVQADSSSQSPVEFAPDATVDQPFAGDAPLNPLHQEAETPWRDDFWHNPFPYPMTSLYAELYDTETGSNLYNFTDSTDLYATAGAPSGSVLDNSLVLPEGPQYLGLHTTGLEETSGQSTFLFPQLSAPAPLLRINPMQQSVEGTKVALAPAQHVALVPALVQPAAPPVQPAAPPFSQLRLRPLNLSHLRPSPFSQLHPHPRPSPFSQLHPRPSLLNLSHLRPFPLNLSRSCPSPFSQLRPRPSLLNLSHLRPFPLNLSRSRPSPFSQLRLRPLNLSHPRPSPLNLSRPRLLHLASRDLLKLGCYANEHRRCNPLRDRLLYIHSLDHRLSNPHLHDRHPSFPVPHRLPRR